MTTSPSQRPKLIVSAIALALVAGVAGFGIAHLQTPKASTSPAADGGRRVLYWYDPMAPAQHFDKPGKSPFMDMQLVPRYAGEGDSGASAGAPGVRIDPAVLQNLGVRTAVVEEGAFASRLDAAGVLDFNQRDVAVVQARAAGFVQRVYARAPGDVVRAGAPIADLLVPTWGGAEAEYLAVRQTGNSSLEDASRQRLRLLGMPEPMIASVASSGRPRDVMTVTTPIGGAIQTLDVRQGMTVSMGQTLAQVSGLSTVWLNAAVPEAMAGEVRVGETARAELASFPGETFVGRVTAILPTAQAESRTLTVRVELSNKGGRLRPGMFATVHLNGEAKPSLFVPSEAVIRTGKRALVMVAGEGGRFQPVEVQLGREDGDRTEILAGLSEGQKVVASGQFLIDSEASLSGIQARPLDVSPRLAAPTSPTASSSATSSRVVRPKPAETGPTLYRTRGRVEAITGDQITLSHEAVPALGWPAMTMTFTLDPPSLAKGMKVGDRVAIGFEQKPEGPIVRQLAPAGGAQ